MHPKAKPTWKVNIDQVWEFQLYGPSKEVLGNNQWIFICRTDAEAETPILRPLDVKNWLIGKDPDAGKDWGQEKTVMTEDEMVGWHHQLDGHVFEWAPGVGEGQGSLACWSPWGHKELDMTEWLNWTELKIEHFKWQGSYIAGSTSTGNCFSQSLPFLFQWHISAQSSQWQETKGTQFEICICVWD